MVSESSSGPEGVSEIWLPRGGSLCLGEDDQMSSVLHPPEGGSQSSRGGCIAAGLDISDYVCISSSSSTFSGPAQIHEFLQAPDQQVSHSSSSMLDDGSLVSHSNQCDEGPPNALKVQEVIGDSGFQRSSSSQCQESEVNYLETRRRVLQQKGFSKSVCNAVEKAVKKGTEKTYGSAWGDWVRWCQGHNLDPTSISVNKLAEFITDLFKSGLAWSSIGVRRSAVCSVLEPDQNPTSGEHPVISKLMRSFFLRRPPRKKIFPPWEVKKLVDLLRSWTPCSSLSNIKLAWKTATLLALAATKRCADLSLLLSDNEHCFFHGNSVTLVPAFGAKTDRPKHRMPQFTLRSFKDKRLCPVAHLKEYFLRTASRRSASAKQIFISNSKEGKDVSAKTIGSWIRSTLRCAGLSTSPGAVRSASASAAFYSGVPVDKIMRAGDWSNVGTVFRHYIQSEVLVSPKSGSEVQKAVLSLY